MDDFKLLPWYLRYVAYRDGAVDIVLQRKVLKDGSDKPWYPSYGTWKSNPMKITLTFSLKDDSFVATPGLGKAAQAKLDLEYWGEVARDLETDGAKVRAIFKEVSA